MIQNKKVLIILMSIILLAIIAVVVTIVLINNNKNNYNNQNIEENITEKENIEEDFKKAFNIVEYSQEENASVIQVYELKEINENKYNVNVHLPKINSETNITQNINDEIVTNFGGKLLDIINNSTSYTLYNVDYITYVNNNILSIVIKSILKEGSNPQRTIVQTYNYDLENDKEISLEDMLKLKEIGKADIQSKIIKTIRERNENSKAVADQGYNIYVRDIRSEEYLVDNIKTYYLGEDGALYIVFAYGNTNFTETIDIIKI